MGLMEIILIVLILIGIAVIVASFVFSDKIWGREDRDIQDYKEELTAEMDRVLEKHVRTAEGRIEDTAKESLQYYVDEARREIEVALNEAKAALEQYSAQTHEEMQSCVKQTQEESVGIAEETRQKLQGISDEVIREINNYHNEVTVLFSMLNNKQDEINENVKIVEQVSTKARDLAAEVEIVKKQADAMSQSAEGIREEFISEIKEGLIQELAAEDYLQTVRQSSETEEPKEDASVSEPTKAIDSEELKGVLQALEQQEKKEQEIPDDVLLNLEETEVTIADVEEIEDISDDTVKAVVEEVLNGEELEAARQKDARQAEEEAAAATAQSEPEEEPKQEETGEASRPEEEPKKGQEVSGEDVPEKESGSSQTKDLRETEKAEAADQEPEKPQPEEQKLEKVKTEEPKPEESGTEESQPEEPKPEESGTEESQPEESGTEEPLPEDFVMGEAPNKLLKAVRESGTVSTEADFEARKAVLNMYENGQTSMEIAKSLNLGIGEVRMIIDLYSRRER